MDPAMTDAEKRAERLIEFMACDMEFQPRSLDQECSWLVGQLDAAGLREVGTRLKEAYHSYKQRRDRRAWRLSNQHGYETSETKIPLMLRDRRFLTGREKWFVRAGLERIESERSQAKDKEAGSIGIREEIMNRIESGLMPNELVAALVRSGRENMKRRCFMVASVVFEFLLELRDREIVCYEDGGEEYLTKALVCRHASGDLQGALRLSTRRIVDFSEGGCKTALHYEAHALLLRDLRRLEEALPIVEKALGILGDITSHSESRNREAFANSNAPPQTDPAVAALQERLVKLKTGIERTLGDDEPTG